MILKELLLISRMRIKPSSKLSLQIQFLRLMPRKTLIITRKESI
jgi:hypothetical protein